MALQKAETLMLDMDGTLLDLAFDNYMWMDLVPRRFADKNGLTFEEAREDLFARFEALQGNLAWYCLDHWGASLGIDVLQLHHDVNHRIGYLPGALTFLQRVKERDIRVLMVTNSHPETLALKDAITGITDYFDGLHVSHNYGYAKESQQFWEALQDDVDFDPATTLFVDDSQPVLQSASDYGIGMLVNVSWPDTTRPVRRGSVFAGVEKVADML